MKNLKTQFAVLLLSTVSLLTGAFGQLTPSGDAYTNTATPTTNFGSKTVLDIESTQTTYIQFDLSAIPSGYTSADITKASLKLYVDAVTTAGSFNVDYVNGTWTESTIDASNAPALGTTIAASVPLTTKDKNQYILVDVTAAVQAWLSGTPNDGIALVANSPLNASFDSKEATKTSHTAELDIVFAGGGTLTGVTTASGSGLTGGGTSGTLNLSLTNACAANQVLQYNGTSWACAAVGTGTVTSVGSGTGLTGGPITGSGTLSINSAVVPLLGAANTFTGNQTVNGTLSATGFVVTGTGFQIGGNLFDYGSLANMNAFLGFAGDPNGVTGTSNVGVGPYALYSNSTGTDNTAVGAEALTQSNSNNNTAIGFFAGLARDGGLLTGGNDTFVGWGTAAQYGNLTNATAIGYGALVSESNALVLGSGGVNVGIGTSAPTYALEVYSGGATVAQMAMVSSGTDAAFSLKNTASGGREYWIDSGSGSAGVGAGNFAIFDRTALATRLVVNSVGNVGIGTITPGHLLDVAGTVAVDSTGLNNGTNFIDLTFGLNAGEGISSSRTAGPNQYGIDLYTDFARRISIAQDGNVGIGTTSPDSLLTVNGSADKPGGGSWGTFSDGRLKNLNGNFNSGLSQVLKLNPVRYRYKADNALGIRDTGEHIGVVAQDVQRVIPEAVTENSKGYLLVNNDPIIWSMLNAIKEQQGEIRALKSELRATRQSLQKVQAQVAGTQPALVAAK